MIYVNGKQIDFTNKSDDYQFKDVVKDYHRTIATFKEKYGNFVLFQTPASIPKIDPITKAQRPHKGYSWPTRTTVITNNASQAWVWSPSAATIKDGVATSSQPNIMITRGDLSLNIDQDAEQIYFMTKIPAFDRGILWVFDSNKEEDERAQAIINESKLKNTIYAEHSPLFMDTDKLKIIASKWGIPNVDTLTINALRNTLYDKVLGGEEQKRKRREGARGIAEFMDDIGGGDAVRVGASIQAGIDKGVLVFDRQNGEWHLSVKKGDMPVVLMSPGFVGGDIARSRLVDYLVRNKPDADLLASALSGDLKVEYGQVKQKTEKDKEQKIVLPEDVNLDNIDEINPDGKPAVTFRMLQKAAKSLGVGSGFGWTYDTYHAKVKEKLEQLAQTV